MPSPVLTPATLERQAAHMKVIAKSFGQEWPEDIAEQEALMAENPILRDQFAKFEPKDVTVISATESSKKTEVDRGAAASQTRNTRAEREKLTGAPSPILQEFLPVDDEYVKGKDQLTGPYGATREASGYPIIETPQFYPTGPTLTEMLSRQSSNAGIGELSPTKEQFLVREEGAVEEPQNFPLQTSDQDVIEKAQIKAFEALDKELIGFGWAYAKNSKEIGALAELKTPAVTKEDPKPAPVWKAKDTKDQAKVDALIADNQAVLSRRWKGMVEALTNPRSIRRKGETRSQAELDVDIFGKNTELGNIPDINVDDAKTLSHFRSSLIQQKQADLVAHGTDSKAAAGEAITWANGIIGQPQWWQNPSLKAAKLREKPETYSVLGFGVDVYPSGTVVETTPAQMARILNAGSSVVSGVAGSLASEVTPGLAKARKESEVAPIKDVTGSTGALGRAVDAGLLNIKTGRGIAEESYDAVTNVVGKSGLDLDTDIADAIKKGAYGTGLIIDIVAMPILPGAGVVKGVARSAKELSFASKVLSEGADFSKAEKVLYTAGRIAEENPVTKAIAKRFNLIPGDIRLVAAEKAFKDVTDLGVAVDLAGKAKAVEASGRSADDIIKELVETNPYGKRMLKELGGAVTPEEAIIWLKKETEGNEIFNKTGATMSRLDDTKTSPWAIWQGATDKLFKANDIPRWIQDTLKMNPDMADLLRKAVADGKIEANPRAILGEILNNNSFRKELLRTIALDKTLAHVIDESSKLPAWKALDENPFYLLTSKTAVASEEAATKILQAARETDVAKAIQEGAKGKMEGVLKQAQEEDAALSGAFFESRIPLKMDGVKAIYSYITSKRTGNVFSSELLDAIETDLQAGGTFDVNGFRQTLSTDSARKLIEMQIDDVARLPVEGKLLALSEKDIARLPQATKTGLLKPVALRPGWIVRAVKDYAKELGLTGDVSTISISAQKTLAAMQAEMSSIDKTLATKLKELTSNQRLWEAYGFATKPTDREAMLALIFVPRPKIFGQGASLGDQLYESLGDANSRAVIIADMIEELTIAGRSGWSKLSDLVSPVALSNWNETRLFIQAELDAAKKALKLELVGEASQFGTTEMASALDYQADAIRRYLAKVEEITKPYNKKGLVSLPSSKTEELLAGLYFTLEKDEIISKHLTTLANETKALNPSREITFLLEEALSRHLSLPSGRNIDISFPPRSAYNPKGSLRLPIIKPTLEDVGHATADEIRALKIERQDEVARMMQDLISMRFKDIAEGRQFEYINFLMRIRANDKRLAGALLVMGEEKAARLFTTIDEIASDIADANQLTKQVDKYGAQRIKKIQGAITSGNWTGLGPDEITIVKNLVNSSFDATKIKDSLSKIASDGRALKLFTWAKDGLLEVQYSLMLSFRTRFHGANFLTAPFIMMSTLGGEETAKAMSSWLDGARLSAFSNDLAKGGDTISGLGKGSRIDSIAFTDVAGRAWSWRDLAEVAREGSILKTQKGSPSATRMLEKNAQFLVDTLPAKPWSRPLQWLRNSPGKAVEFAQSFAEFSDGSFRLAALISSLKRGEDVSQALQKSREALLDYGKITDTERKYIASWFMFYSFTRASAVSTFWNLIENPTRVANQLKLAKGMPLWGDDKDRSLFYEQDYMQLRPLLSNSAGFVKLVDGTRKAKGDRVLTYATPLPAIDSFILFAKILSVPFNMSLQEFEASEVTTERSNPAVKMLIAPGHREDLKRSIVENGYIDPRYITLIKASGQWPWFKDIFDLQSVAEEDPKAFQRSGLQSKTAFREKNPETGLVTNTVQWRLTPNSPQADAFYKLILTAEFIGATSILKDYAPLTAGAAGISQMGPDLTTSPSELFGATTDVRRDAPSSIAEDIKYKEQYSLKPK